MFDRRLTLQALPVGLALGALCWLIVGRASSGAQLGELEARLAQVPPARLVTRSASLVDLTLAAPLFGAVAQVAAAPDPSVALFGVTKTPRRTAALISISGGAADWIMVGETREGVTLQDVRSSSVAVTTANGSRDISLGQAGSSVAGAAVSSQGGSDPSAQGFRSPPPPASAPRTP